MLIAVGCGSKTEVTKKELPKPDIPPVADAQHDEKQSESNKENAENAPKVAGRDKKNDPNNTTPAPQKKLVGRWSPGANGLASFSVPGDLTPFGNLEWHDSLLDVIFKLNKISGVQEITLNKLLVKHIQQDPIDLVGISQKNELVERLATAIKADRSKTTHVTYSHMNKLQAYNIIDANGNEHEVFEDCDYYDITVKTMKICDVPFELTCKFEFCPALAIYEPEDAIVESVTGLLMSLVLNEVILYSDSATLAYKWQEIHNTLANTYANYLGDASQVGSDYGTAQAFPNGAQISFQKEQSSYRITYRNGSLNRYQEAYNQHLSLVEQQKMGTIPNATGML